MSEINQQTNKKTDESTKLDYIDHIAIAVRLETSENICQWYQEQFDVERLEDIVIKTEFNGLLLKVLRPRNLRFYLVFAASLSTEDQSDQIKDFLNKVRPKKIDLVSLN